MAERRDDVCAAFTAGDTVICHLLAFFCACRFYCDTGVIVVLAGFGDTFDLIAIIFEFTIISPGVSIGILYDE